MTRGKSPTSTVVGFALLLNLITGPFLTVLFYGTTLDEKFLKYFPSKTAKNFWRAMSLMDQSEILSTEVIILRLDYQKSIRALKTTVIKKFPQAFFEPCNWVPGDRD